MDMFPDSGNEDLKERLFKILIVGDSGTGKTSIIRRFTEGYFSPNYKLTIGVDFAMKTVHVDNAKLVLQLWDLAGLERFSYLVHVYYKYASAACIVFDLSRPSTFEAILRWLSEIREKVVLPNGDPVPVVLLANKCDLAKDGEIPFQDRLDQLVEEFSLVGWYPTSAKENINVDEAFMTLSKRVLACGDQASIGAQQKQKGFPSSPQASPRRGRSIRSDGEDSRPPEDSTCCGGRR